MFLYDLHNRSKISKFLSSDFKLFELSIWIHVFAGSLIGVFVPIILLQLGYSVGDVILYFFIYHVFDVPLNFLAHWMTMKIGARKVIIWATVFVIAYFIGIFSLSLGNWLLLVLIALFSALYDTFYWVAHLYYFMQTSKNDDNVSRDVSSLYIVRKIAGVIAPIIGAAIFIFLGQKVLIVTSIIFFAISVIPLFYFKNSLDKPKKVISYREFLSDWKTVKDYLYSGMYSIHAAIEFIIWPIFIYVVFSSIESVAALSVIVSLTTAIFTYFSGKIKKENRYQSIVIGSLLVSLIWLSRIFLEQTWVYYFSVFLVSLFSILITIPLDSNVFEKGEDKDALMASTIRNTVHMFTKMILYGFLVLAVSVFSISFVTASLAMFSLVLFIFVGRAFDRRRESRITL
jgi:MFS family permease